MGMYTKLKCTARIKPEYREKIRKRVFLQVKWKKLFHKLNHEFLINRECNKIPFLGNVLTPNEMFDGEVLIIQCEIINRDFVYDDFFEFLNEISDVIEYKTLYEECDGWKEWIKNLK